MRKVSNHKNGCNRSWLKAYLKSGTDLRYIHELLGHKNSKTTEIYTHLAILSDTNQNKTK